MPIYEFRCADCGEVFDKLFRQMQGSGEQAAPACPVCGSLSTARLVSGFAVQGPSGVDAGQVAADNAQANRQASVTSKEQISKWRSAKP